MAIPVMQFQPLTMAQASPGSYGLRNLQKSLLQGLASQQQMQAIIDQISESGLAIKLRTRKERWQDIIERSERLNSKN